MSLIYKDLSLRFIGDIHGDFQKLQQIVKPFTDTVFIICGDCGFGFPDTKEDKIKKMLKSTFNTFLEKRNLYLLFIRGNHDIPSWFDEIYTENNYVLFNERFRLLPDYSIITVNNTNILCVGGAVSVDRRFRKVNTSYWYGEEMSELEALSVKVDILCTHTINREYLAYTLTTPDWLRISFDVDKKLKLDCERENNICQCLKAYYQPKYWIHGHYHISNRLKIGNTKIISLNCNELYEFREDEEEKNN